MEDVAAFLEHAQRHASLEVRVRTGGNRRACIYTTRPLYGAPTCGATKSGFARLCSSASFVRGSARRIFHSIELDFVLGCLPQTDIIVTAEGEALPSDPLVAALRAAERGQPTQGEEEGTETAVQAMALLRMYRLHPEHCTGVPITWNLRQATAPDMAVAAVAFHACLTETLQDTRADTLFNAGPEAPGHTRLVAYEALVPGLREDLASLSRELADEGSATFRALPPGEAAVSRGSAPASAAPLFLRPGDHVLYLQVISAAGGARGAGTTVMRRILALADALGAYVAIRALALDGLPYTFYWRLGFRFVRHTVELRGVSMPLLMVRAPGGPRPLGLLMPPCRAWGTSSKDRFESPSASVSLPPSLQASVAAWDRMGKRNITCARGLHLMALDGVLEAHTAGRTSRYSPPAEWGARGPESMPPEEAAALMGTMTAPPPPALHIRLPPLSLLSPPASPSRKRARFHTPGAGAGALTPWRAVAAQLADNVPVLLEAVRAHPGNAHIARVTLRAVGRVAQRHARAVVAAGGVDVCLAVLREHAADAAVLEEAVRCLGLLLEEQH